LRLADARVRHGSVSPEAGSGRVQNGYVSSGTGGHARPLLAQWKKSVSGENVPGRAREWTRVPHLSFPRNEGVPGSSPGVGFLAHLQGVLSDQAVSGTRSGSPLGPFRVRNGYVRDPFSIGEVVPLPATDWPRLQGIHSRVAITWACPPVPASARA